ncbi:MAG: hypothetical protein ABDH28_03885 [Brevinematia bacterium]
MNYKRTINHFIKNLLLDLPPKLRKKIAKVVLYVLLPLGKAGMLGLGGEGLRIAWVSYEHEVFRILFHKKIPNS